MRFFRARTPGTEEVGGPCRAAKGPLACGNASVQVEDRRVVVVGCGGWWLVGVLVLVGWWCGRWWWVVASLLVRGVAWSAVTVWRVGLGFMIFLVGVGAGRWRCDGVLRVDAG